MLAWLPFAGQKQQQQQQQQRDQGQWMEEELHCRQQLLGCIPATSCTPGAMAAAATHPPDPAAIVEAAA
jgi:hypothetical protein